MTHMQCFSFSMCSKYLQHMNIQQYSTVKDFTLGNKLPEKEGESRGQQRAGDDSCSKKDT